MGSTPVGISASRGAAILGLSEYQTQFEVWQLLCEEREPGFNARRGYALPERKDSPPLRWGKAFEDAIVALAEEREGLRIGLREQLFLSDGFSPIDAPPTGPEFFMSCHIDGMFKPDVRVNPPISPLHEGKTTSLFPFREKWGDDGTDQVPRTYQVQGQHEFICTGAEREILSLLVFPETQEKFEKLGWRVESEPGRWILQRGGEDGACPEGASPHDWARVFSQIGNFHTYYLEPRPELGRLLVDGYRHFWDHHVVAGVEPTITEYDDIKRAFPEPKGTMVCGPEEASWFAEMAAIKAEIGKGGSLAKHIEELEVRALNWARAQNAVIDDDSRKATIFRDEEGNKLGQFSKNKKGVFSFLTAKE